MSMWLVHIKEYVWTIRTCPTTVLLSAMSECASECCIERLNEGIASYEMAGLYAPQGVDLGGGGSPSRKVEWHSMQSGLSRKIVKWRIKIYKSQVLKALYKCTEMKWKKNESECAFKVHRVFFILHRRHTSPKNSFVLFFGIMCTHWGVLLSPINYVTPPPLRHRIKKAERGKNLQYT